jgi:uncharacterized membrane protein
MPLPYRRTLWAVITAGTLARLVVAATSDGVPYDLASFAIVDATLRGGDPLVLYSAVNEGAAFGPYPRWPYPSGFLPILVATGSVAEQVGLGLDHLIRVPLIAADAAIALIVADALGRRGASERARLLGAALVAFGPAFAAISGYHGQIDAIAILPAVAAVWLWDRPGVRHRALLAGALVGLGGAIKTAPLLMVLALLPTVRSRREGVVLLAAAAAVPVVAMLPFLLADAAGVLSSLRYRGGAGLGGISLLVQPELAAGWLAGSDVRLSTVSRALLDAGVLVTLPVVLAAGVLAVRQRVPAVDAAVLLWLAFYVAGVNFFMQYLVWGLPFLLMRGHLRAVAALQLALLPALVLTYAVEPSAALVWTLYTPPLIAAWAVALVAFAALVRRVTPPAPPTA